MKANSHRPEEGTLEPKAAESSGSDCLGPSHCLCPELADGQRATAVVFPTDTVFSDITRLGSLRLATVAPMHQRDG